MIKELTKEEIKVVEDYIRLMKDYYPYYFLGEPKEYSERGFLVSDSYYVNLQRADDKMFLGICRLREEKSLSQLVALFLRLLRENKKLYVWAYKYNTNIKELLERAKIYLENKNIAVKTYGDDIIFYEFWEV